MQAESKMTTESRSGFKPHTVEYTKPQQVNVPVTYALQQLIVGTYCGLPSGRSRSQCAREAVCAFGPNAD